MISIVNITNIDLNLLRVFNAVHAEKNVTRAALRLGISQPAISNAMSRLRRSMGDPLFVRTSHGMEPTALAMRIAEPVRQALELLSTTLESPASFDPRASSKVFRLLMSDAGEAVVFPLLMSRLATVAPDIKLHVVVAPHSQYASLMEEGSVDLAVGNLRFLGSNFYQQRLFNDPYRCICSLDHPLAAGGRLGIQAYVGAQHISVGAGNAESLIEQALAKRRLQRNIQLRLSNYHVAVQVVRRTRLLATVPRAMVSAKVASFPLPFAVPAADVRQFWHLRAHHDPANIWFRSLLAELFSERRAAQESAKVHPPA